MWYMCRMICSNAGKPKSSLKTDLLNIEPFITVFPTQKVFMLDGEEVDV